MVKLYDNDGDEIGSILGYVNNESDGEPYCVFRYAEDGGTLNSVPYEDIIIEVE